MEFHSFTINCDGKNPLEIRDQLIQFEGKRTIFDLDKIICEKQIQVALSRTERAFEMDTAVAKNWGIEVIVHLVGDHQISNCLEIVGITKNTKRIGIIQENEKIEDKAVKGLEISDPSKELIRLYGISSNSNEPCLDIISKGVSIIINHE